mmetsp:Transcript_10212/g.19599  ORF Transcript_10212/g.19599 Transcript_10212/m.19599 type:complete len:194 (+) Transcript_10212:90-671(+)|eukprot:scaffold35516_cov191-Amphora_coffeaeformis.AAC.1
MESSNRTAELKQPLLDLEDVPLENRYRGDKSELDYEHHVSSLCSEVEAEDKAICSEDFIMWVILPTLLFSQFGMAFLMHDVRTSSLSFTVVNISIVLFVVTAWLYRHACADVKIQTIALLLLPEILMDVVLGLVLFNRVELGFMVLLVSMLCLSSFVVISTATFLYCGRKDHEEKFEEEEEEESNTLTMCQVV